MANRPTIEDQLARMIELLEQIAAGGGEEEAEEAAEEEEVAQPAKNKKDKKGKKAKDEEEPTLDDARATLKAYLDATSSADLKKLLAKFKVKKLSDLDESKYGDIIAAAQEGMPDGDGEASDDDLA